MAAHHVEISLPTKPLRNVDATIAVWQGDEKLGELRISKGGVDWAKGRAKKTKSFKWERLARLPISNFPRR